MISIVVAGINYDCYWYYQYFISASLIRTMTSSQILYGFLLLKFQQILFLDVCTYVTNEMNE